MSFGDKEKRNKEVKAMEVKAIDLLSTFYRTDKTIEDVCAEVHLLHKKHLKRVKYTGTPENTKEIEDLASSWDFCRVLYKRHRDSGVSFDHITYNHSTFSPLNYININDYVEESYESEATKEKVLILEINPNNQGETL